MTEQSSSTSDVAAAFVQASLPGFNGRAPDNWRVPEPEPPEAEEPGLAGFESGDDGVKRSPGAQRVRESMARMVGGGIDSVTLSTKDTSVTFTKEDAKRLRGMGSSLRGRSAGYTGIDPETGEILDDDDD